MIAKEEDEEVCVEKTGSTMGTSEGRVKISSCLSSKKTHTTQ